jgi:hypothetical protein
MSDVHGPDLVEFLSLFGGGAIVILILLAVGWFRR